MISTFIRMTMIALLNIIQSSEIWDELTNISTPWSLAAFALAVALYLMLKKRKGEVPFAAWLIIVLLVAVPIAASIYGNVSNTSKLYRLRVTVVDPQGIPVEDAKVWSSFGGEPKRVAGGWQFDIPFASKPQDGKLSLFASKEIAFLTGQTDLILGNDYNPVVTVSLKRDVSAKVRGQVVDGRNRAVAGARVFIVGHEFEAILTKEGGKFELPAHAEYSRQVLLCAEKPGFPAVKLWHPAGDAPAVLRLER